MSKPAVLCAWALALAAVSTGAQEKVKPLTQSELLKTIDSIGASDPLTAQPLSLGDTRLPGTPEPKKEEKPPPPKKEKGPTEITALEATFDQKAHQAIFLRNVVVIDPEFNVTCDKLTAFLKHDDKPAPGEKPNGGKPTGKPAATPIPIKATPKPADPPSGTKPAKPAGEQKGGLERAIAEGSVVITQDKVEAGGTVTRNIGRARKADYNAATGDIVLTGNPQVQQGINTCVATEDSTVMTLNRDGHMHVNGPSKSIISDASSADKTEKTTRPPGAAR